MIVGTGAAVSLPADCLAITVCLRYACQIIQQALEAWSLLRSTSIL
eukprot:COSAG02_NODE_18014_length_966_cov_0.854671_1_plen_45_part_10